MNKSNPTNWLSALCTILLIVVLALQIKQKNELETLTTNLESRLAEDEQQANEKMGDTMNAVQQQTSVLSRFIGPYIPIELPAGLSNQLANLEAQIADTSSWPKNQTEFDQMYDNLSNLVQQIPAWAEDDYLPRLNKLRWAVQSLQVIQANENAQGEDLDAAADAYADQLSIQPDGGSTNIAEVLTGRYQNATNRYAAFRLKNTIYEATNQLSYAVTDDGLAATAWQNLAEWTNDPTQGQYVLELRRELHAQLLEDAIANFICSSTNNLQALNVVTNSVLRQEGYARLLDSVTEQRLDILEQPDVSPDSRNQLEELYKTVEMKLKDEADKQNRGYQQWALEQIASFRVEFDTAMHRTRPGAVFGTNSDPDLTGVRNAMVKHLLQISPGYLDTAVAMIYRQAFDDGMNKLDGNLQLSVANEDAKMPKKTPQNYLEN